MKPLLCTLVLLVSLCPRCAWGWGTGHDPMTELAMERLPEPVAAFLPAEARRAAARWSHAPDDFTPWSDYEQKRGVPIAADDLRLLTEFGLTTPYSLHSSKGQAVNALLLVNGMRSGDTDRCAFWIGCLLHTFCDEAACNHDPLVHYMTYAFTGGYGMTFPGPGYLDVGELCRAKDGRALVWQVAGQLQVPRPTADRFLVEVMLHGYHANEFMTRRGTRVAQAFAANASEAQIRDSYRALAELGAYGVLSGLGVIQTAWERAQGDRPPPELTSDILKQFSAEKAAYLAARPLDADSLYAALLPLAAPPEQAAIGVLLETSQRMNDGILAFGGKLISAAVMRHLARRSVPFRAVDVRALAQASPDPALLPAMLVCSGRFSSSAMARNLTGYRERGGRILMIGGAHGNCLGALSEALVKADPAVLPVSAKYGRNNTEVIDKLSVVFKGAFARTLGDAERRFLHNPDTRAGWQKPVCLFQLAEDHGAGVRPLAALRLNGQSYEVAAVSLCREGSAEAVFVPAYLLAPYLLTESPPLENPSEPILDEVGQGVLDAALDLLVPAVAGLTQPPDRQ